jgi:tRNA U34 5-methylaminomethyl-2-thiouridine-forming methyltransferase MnmC
MMDLEPKKTDDGSYTLYVPALNEHYHSTYGALQESMHIFIRAGLHECTLDRTKLNVLEAGFGTGLNAILTYEFAVENKIMINYLAIEKHPLQKDLLKKLHFEEIVMTERSLEVFYNLHEAGWGFPVNVCPDFTITKNEQDLQKLELQDESLDLIYHDAFAPEVQPELWSQKIFDMYYKALQQGGIMVTYSCKGIVKRNLKNAGFIIEKLPGPEGKREILRARKP